MFTTYSYIFSIVFLISVLWKTLFSWNTVKIKFYEIFYPFFSYLNSFDPLIYEQKYVCVQYSTYEAQDLEYISFTKNVWITIINILTPWGFSETKIKTSQSSSTVRHWHCRVKLHCASLTLQSLAPLCVIDTAESSSTVRHWHCRV